MAHNVVKRGHEEHTPVLRVSARRRVVPCPVSSVSSTLLYTLRPSDSAESQHPSWDQKANCQEEFCCCCCCFGYRHHRRWLLCRCCCCCCGWSGLGWVLCATFTTYTDDGDGDDGRRRFRMKEWKELFLRRRWMRRLYSEKVLASLVTSISRSETVLSRGDRCCSRVFIANSSLRGNSQAFSAPAAQ